MGLAALICAYHESDEPGGPLRAVLPIAGRTLVERQIRLARSAGAGTIILFIERMPPSLTAALDRLRAEGVMVEIARSAAQAAEAVEPGDPILLIADGLVADAAHVAHIVSTSAPALLTLPNAAGDDRFERIDPESRWAGLALLDGASLRRTASTLGDWDLQSTLLRRAVQEGALQFAVPALAAGGEVVIAEQVVDLAEAETMIVEAASSGRDDWASIYLLAPIERWATRILMTGNATPGLVAATATALTALAAILFFRGSPGFALGALLLATPLDGIEARLQALRLESSRKSGWSRHLLPLFAGSALGALAWALTPTRGWGCLVIALATVAFLFALEKEKERGVASRFLAERKGMSWLLLPFGVTGYWATGLAALGLYAAGSFFWAQRRHHGAERTAAER